MIYKEILLQAAGELRTCGIDTAELDARLLLELASGFDRAQLFLNYDEIIPENIAERFIAYIKRRLNREPVSRIKGAREFWSLPFIIDESTLDPRPDSETLVETVLAMVDKNQKYTLLDLGTGSGCLLIALLTELKLVYGLGVDISDAALAVARQNAIVNKVDERVEFQASDWFAAVTGKYDIIISNPPYIIDGTDLAPEVKNYDPDKALYGGKSGLECYELLIPQAFNFLNHGGILAVEVGQGQCEDVKKLFELYNYKQIEVVKDLAGIQRIILAKKS
jgi:release factor glutamine methyltransferase